MALQSIPKLCVPRLVESLYAAFDDKGGGAHRGGIRE
jgi:hypothetical protein